jgi:hypothetical protein
MMATLRCGRSAALSWAFAVCGELSGINDGGVAEVVYRLPL